MTIRFFLRDYFFKMWYWYVNRIDKNAEILFMNYGYYDKDQHDIEEAHDNQNRYSIQLYHHLASAAEIKNKDVVEIGCGRGGGLAYIFSHFSAKSAHGIDLNKQAITFCKSHHKENGLTFMQGNAQNLKLGDNTTDIVINVESSHRYPNMKMFLSEVYRILRPGGYFLLTDFRYDYDMEKTKKDLDSCGLTLIKQKIINKEVIAALDLEDSRKRVLIKRLAPKFLYTLAHNFAATIGSQTYNSFVSNKYVYFSYVFIKPLSS